MSLINQMLRDLESRNHTDKVETGASIDTPTVAANPSGIRKTTWLLASLIIIALIFGYSQSGFKRLFSEPPDISQSKPDPAKPTVSQTVKAPVKSKLVATPIREATPIKQAQSSQNVGQSKDLMAVNSEPSVVPSLSPKQQAEQLLFEAKKMKDIVLSQSKLQQALSFDPTLTEAKQLLAESLLKQVAKEKAISTPKPQQSKQAKATQPSPSVTASQAKKSKPRVRKQKKRLTAKQRAAKLFNQAKNSAELSVRQRKLQQALQIQPDYLQARILLAKTLLKQGMISQTTQLLEDSLAMFPQNLQLIKARAQIHLQQKQFTVAYNLLTQFDWQNSQDETYLSLIAVASQKKLAHHTAAIIYQKLVHLNPQKASYWLGLAISQDALNNNKQAHQAYQQALTKQSLSLATRSYINQRIHELK